MATPALILKTGDTAPAWLATLSDINGPIALAGNVTSVKIAGKGQNTSTAIGPSATTVASENSFTATVASGNAQLTAVSAFTGIARNSTLVGVGIPLNAVVGSFNSGAGTINMVAAGSITLDNPSGTAINATVSGTGVALIANRGQVTYTPTLTDSAVADVYGCEFAVHLTAGGLFRVPNQAALNPTIEIDAALLAGE